MVAGMILGILGLDASGDTYVEDRLGHSRRYLLDSTKIRTELGWTQRIPFERGMRETVLWYKESETWWRPLLSRLQVNEEQWK